MRAVTVIPGQQGSVALAGMPEPSAADGPVLVQTWAIGVCGTDLEIINGDYGWEDDPELLRLITVAVSLARARPAAAGPGDHPGKMPW